MQVSSQRSENAPRRKKSLFDTIFHQSAPGQNGPIHKGSNTRRIRRFMAHSELGKLDRHVFRPEGWKRENQISQFAHEANSSWEGTMEGSPRGNDLERKSYSFQHRDFCVVIKPKKNDEACLAQTGSELLTKPSASMKGPRAEAEKLGRRERWGSSKKQDPSPQQRNWEIWQKDCLANCGTEERREHGSMVARGARGLCLKKLKVRKMEKGIGKES